MSTTEIQNTLFYTLSTIPQALAAAFAIMAAFVVIALSNTNLTDPDRASIEKWLRGTAILTIATCVVSVFLLTFVPWIAANFYPRTVNLTMVGFGTLCAIIQFFLIKRVAQALRQMLPKK